MSRKNYRKRKVVEEDSEEENESTDVKNILEETRELQMFRKRQKGVSAVGLAFGAKTCDAVAEVVSDPFKMKTGGLVEMGSIKDRDRDRTGEERDKDVTNLGNNFSIETNVRDEDVEMLKFIDEELAKRKGQDKGLEERRKSTSKDDLLYAVPDHINVKSKIMRSEEMLSNQMLSGIPEVDLGIEAKIKNIEETEEAKLKQREESRKTKMVASEFVPTNIAANFMHHDRFYDEQKALEKEKQKERRKKQEEANVVQPRGPVVGADIVENIAEFDNVKPASGDKQSKKKDPSQASDDFIYEKFRKRTRDSWRYQ